MAGDIAESHILGSTLESLATLTGRPVYFVLGSHDFYRGSVACTCRQVGHVGSVADVKAFVVFSSANWRMITGTIFILSSLAIREQVAATGPPHAYLSLAGAAAAGHLCPRINDAAEACRGVIPADCWKVPYMSREELRHEISDAVVFWGCEEDSELAGVMGMQELQDVTLIRHAYVRTARRNQGIGGRLLAELLTHTARPVLVGTWAAAEWAIHFYQRHGFQMVSPAGAVAAPPSQLMGGLMLPDGMQPIVLVGGKTAEIFKDISAKSLPRMLRCGRIRLRVAKNYAMQVLLPQCGLQSVLQPFTQNPDIRRQRTPASLRPQQRDSLRKL